MNQSEDVEIILGHNRRYKFHSGTLARNSVFFSDLLVEPTAVKLSNRARIAGIKIRWMVELTCLPCTQYPAGRLDLVDLDKHGDRVDGRSGLIVNENGRVPEAHKVFKYYETILYSFYNKELTIDDSDMQAALIDCVSLIEISDYLGCTGLISKPIEVALVKHGQELFRAIQKKPWAWINVSYRIRSELIFRECLIHLVGNWKIFRSQRPVVDTLRIVPGVRAVVEKYHRRLLSQCEALEHKILTYYPEIMQRPVSDLPIKREAYAKGVLIWMALSWFRQWLTQRIVKSQARLADDCGFKLYTQLGLGGDAYMDKTMLNQFHTHFPMTKKALNVLENHLFEIKELVKKIVKNKAILKSNCQLDVGRFPVGYLTCTVFEKGDYPWKKDNRKIGVLPAKREYKPGGNDVARSNISSAREHMEGKTVEKGSSMGGGSEDEDGDEDVEGEFEDEDEDEDEDMEGYEGESNKRARIE